ncbi:23S rRNA (adenine(2503)-C(2))-methyltransferase RlmN [Eubacterium oxidoreducens]|uniref:Probable dual-specificity RNA methyltransferase RlmN n=1 Tax=Eubacterium oxidoreducens TaxID=1732 RepID=A0A1G6B616_EUBOX|nr:23S rRNA (adenine(2503)-C(2))-methyltransferase RlmN [Eubacterium oxidoreducens]SDB16106.1 23S rRNA (adenine2503-C2)-methyltransferase [Eubacterium oxidoreducens]
MSKVDIRSCDRKQLQDYMESLGEKAFRAKQLYGWLHQKMAKDYKEMGNIPKSLKEKLVNTGELTTLKIKTMQESKIDGTRKYLFELPDGHLIESVWMKYKHGNSVCISSQVGCKMNCSFCASAIGGWVRNLTAGEMLEQIYRISRDTQKRVSNVVVMGTGEPLDNYDNLVKFIHMLSDKNGLNISQRSITVSTCGIVPMINKLAQEKLQITLALSLHAADQKRRCELMPIANTYEIHEVVDACRNYFEQTGRRVSFEYSLIQGKNDSKEDAQLLARLLKGMNCHVNLIPINPVRERSYVQPDMSHVQEFKNNLEKYMINVTIRRELGRDIDGACGQLRKGYLDSVKETPHI